MLNTEVFDKVRAHNAKILVVTKYWNIEETQEILDSCQRDYLDVFFGLGENRTESLQMKGGERKNTHFIGNIQSREIQNIVRLCSTIHSLSSIRHAQKIENQGLHVTAFIQIRLDNNKSIGISEEELQGFIDSCKNFKKLKIIGISGMGAGDISEVKKRAEFKKLISLRDTYIPHGLISAGTSRDYRIALEEGIDIVRVGQKVINIDER